jgi:hypothetical protein
MTDTVTTEEQITPDWLTNVLRRNGHLVQGSVTALNKEGFKTLFSLFYRLEAQYSNDAIPALPSKLLLKLPLPDNEASFGMIAGWTIGARLLPTCLLQSFSGLAARYRRRCGGIILKGYRKRTRT